MHKGSLKISNPHKQIVRERESDYATLKLTSLHFHILNTFANIDQNKSFLRVTSEDRETFAEVINLFLARYLLEPRTLRSRES